MKSFDFDIKKWFSSLDLTWKRIFKKHLDINHAPTEEEIVEILNLQQIDCSNSYIISLEPLQKLEKLVRLNTSNTKIVSLERIANCTLIDELDCSNTYIESLIPLENMVNIWNLKCNNTKIKSLDGLESITNLEYIDCSNTDVSTLKPLLKLNKLKQIVYENTKVQSNDLVLYELKEMGITLIPDLIEENINEDLDPLFIEAAKLFVAHQQGSTSLIQRRMSLGYNRAGKIIDQLESVGIVGPFDGSNARKVLIKNESELEELLSIVLNYQNNKYDYYDLKNIESSSTETTKKLENHPVQEKQEGILKRIFGNLF